MNTLTEMERHYGITHLDHLDKSAAIPVVSGVAFQGDVAVVKREGIAATCPIPATGYPVVRGENGGNTHALFGEGFFDPSVASATDLTLGVLTVPDGVDVLLTHPEHGGLLIAPGRYEIRRQREQADVIRVVAD